MRSRFLLPSLSLQQIEPVERIAYAYHVYQIDPLTIDAEQE